MLRPPLALAVIAALGCASTTAPPVQGPPQAAAPLPPPGAPPPASASPPEIASAAPPCAGAAGCQENAPEPTADGGMPASDDGEPDDDTAEAEGPLEPPKAPVIKMTDQEIAARLRSDPESLGSLSVGSPNAGALYNGVQMPKGEHWQLVDPGNAWGTRETVDLLSHGINKVSEQFPSAQPVFIGHISGKHGGHLSPHKSHQSGRDVDVGYYYRTASPRWFARATADNLDVEKTWALLKSVIQGGDVEMIFIDTSIQRLLADYAAKHGEDDAFLDAVFQVRGHQARTIVRYAKGHATHLHIRFFNPMAQEMGRRAHIHIAPPSPSAPPPSQVVYLQHKARSGDTLVILAKRYGTTVEAIQEANGLKGIALRAGVVYKIPAKAPAKAATPAAASARKPQAGKAVAKAHN